MVDTDTIGNYHIVPWWPRQVGTSRGMAASEYSPIMERNGSYRTEYFLYLYFVFFFFFFFAKSIHLLKLRRKNDFFLICTI